jgi:2-keto-4-pentenoate hydratase/2-oxohepta-3-ene-1,7-dioic acid hydratase in catechol pathway
MVTVDRRTMLATGALALAGAASQTGGAEAQAGPKPLFPVPVTTIPIVGETEVFAVRRIYCIGRNYAAHAIERGRTDLKTVRSLRAEGRRHHLFRHAGKCRPGGEG